MTISSCDVAELVVSKMEEAGIEVPDDWNPEDVYSMLEDCELVYADNKRAHIWVVEAGHHVFGAGGKQLWSWKPMVGNLPGYPELYPTWLTRRGARYAAITMQKKNRYNSHHPVVRYRAMKYVREAENERR